MHSKDAIKVEQVGPVASSEVPSRDKVSQKRVREALLVAWRNSSAGFKADVWAGTKDQVDPDLRHLIGSRKPLGR